MRLSIIEASTRPHRFGEHVIPWIVSRAEDDTRFESSLLDLRDFNLPFFNETISPSSVKDSSYANKEVRKWAEKINTSDAFLVVTPEYNHGYPAVLKNAFDHTYHEWVRKPIAFVAYGGAGGARAVEQLRLVAIELQMAPIRQAVHIQAPWTLREGDRLKDGALLPYEKPLTIVLDELYWWGSALKGARTK